MAREHAAAVTAFAEEPNRSNAEAPGSNRLPEASALEAGTRAWSKREENPRSLGPTDRGGYPQKWLGPHHAQQ